ncbi:MAG: hypothetical protein RLZZ116_1722 [Planctomycetota bacterium]|jgi:hypothetical protein
MKLSRILLTATSAALAFASATSAQTVTRNKVLFDATKAQMAGNADWIIDADVNNVGTGAGGLMVVGGGTESNPQRFPTPPQSGITATTPETYWKGALSAWGVALVKRGFSVETLPIGGRITFGDPTNVQDLSNYGVYVIPEPNILFTLAEKQAIIRFIQAGGGVFFGGNHSGSDRNNDTFDPVEVYNDLFTNNGIAVNPFGFASNANSITLIASFPSTDLAAAPLLNGPAGTVSTIEYNAGSTITVTGAARGVLFSTAARLNSDAMFAYSTYGLGRVVMLGDSSPPDDGTGDTADTLFNGWFAEAGGDHADLCTNACIWLNPPAPPACPADINQNGSVDGADLTVLLQSWGPCANCAADINQNGSVDGADLTVLLQSWGGCQ